jgi:hypothetical protein
MEIKCCKVVRIDGDVAETLIILAGGEVPRLAPYKAYTADANEIRGRVLRTDRLQVINEDDEHKRWFHLNTPEIKVALEGHESRHGRLETPEDP